MTGLKRNMAPKILKLLEIFPVILILGARQVGKTTLAKELKPHWQYFDLERPEDLEAVTRNPALFFQHYFQDIIFDEAQEYPELFRILRGEIDRNPNQVGRFILTGSSSPELMKHASDTLAGRIAIVELGTLKANEFYEVSLSSFYNLFSEKLDAKNIIFGNAPLSIQQITEVWFKGGYPKPLLMQNSVSYNQWFENYRDTYINRDIQKLFPRLNKIAYQRFLSIIGKLSCTIINKKDLARAIEISEPSVAEYLNIIEGTFIWRNLSSYEKNIVKSVIKMPKGYIRDSGLFHYLSRITSFDELLKNYLLGSSFELFVIEEILKGLESTSITNWDAHYYRTRNGAEIDLILEGSFGILPIEIKYGNLIRLKQITALVQFVNEHNLPLGIVINQSERIEWLTEKIVQIPVGWI